MKSGCFAPRAQGLAVDKYALAVLGGHLPRNGPRQELVATLQAWLDEPAETDGRQSADSLLLAIDEDRLSERQLYPPDLKGKTW